MKKSPKPSCGCEKPCPTCGDCQRCYCSCQTCLTCSRRVPARKFCERCRTCTRPACCECRNAPRFTPDRNLNIISGRGLINRLPRALGVELEIGDWRTLAPTAQIPHINFTATHDWSVKPSEQEMVLVPMRHDAFIRGMLSLSKEVYRAGCVVNETCALHVHVEGKDLSQWDLRRLLSTYERLEPQIYSHLIAPHRLGTEAIHYCQMMTTPHKGPCSRCERYDAQYPGQRILPEKLSRTLSRMWQARSTGDLKLCLLRMLYGIEDPSNIPTEVNARKGGRYEFCRYFGLNLHSWNYRLTVEWRMKEATLDPTEMVCWPLWCGWLTHISTRMSDAESRSDLTVRSVTDKYMPKFLQEWIRSKGL